MHAQQVVWSLRMAKWLTAAKASSLRMSVCTSSATPLLPVLYVLQALTLAPLFVWFELLFLLGYRPQLYADLQKRVAADLTKLKKKAA